MFSAISVMIEERTGGEARGRIVFAGYSAQSTSSYVGHDIHFETGVACLHCVDSVLWNNDRRRDNLCARCTLAFFTVVACSRGSRCTV